MKLLPIASLLLISLAACTEPVEEIGPATTGIYRLTADPIIDTCSPTDTQTQWTVGLFRTADRLSYAVPTPSPQIGGRQRHAIDPALPFEYESLIDGACAYGRRLSRFEVITESPDRVEAMLGYTWSDVVRCANDTSNSQLPADDCSTQRGLTYQLVEPCESPCVVLEAGDVLSCSC